MSMPLSAAGRRGRYVKQAVAVVIRRRTHRQRPPLTLSRRRLYILPTRSGNLFALILVVMLLGATNYSNSLAFALTFWLVAIALVSMHRAHRNLLGVELLRVSAKPVFAGQNASFEITLASHARRARYALRVGVSGSHTRARADLPAGATVTVRVATRAPRRGVLACPDLQVESRYPLGLFRVWSRVAPAVETWVYPKPVGRDRLPETAAGAQNGAQALRRGREEFLDHRRYRPGDSPRHIDWKASARSEALLVREYAEYSEPAPWFDYHALAGLALEQRLSQLALWVTRAAAAGRVYGLRLPDATIGPDAGAAHRAACLKALALF